VGRYREGEKKRVLTPLLYSPKGKRREEKKKKKKGEANVLSDNEREGNWSITERGQERAYGGPVGDRGGVFPGVLWKKGP